MFRKLKGFIAGFLTAILVMSAGIAAAGTFTRETRELLFGVNVSHNGQPVPFEQDMRPFITGGRTFLPLAAISSLLDVPITWAADTQTVHLGRVPGQVRVQHLFQMPYSDIGSNSWFQARGNERENSIRIGVGSSGQNHIVYDLDMSLSSILYATLPPPSGALANTGNVIYRIYGDGRLLYESPEMHPAVPPINIELDVSGVRQLRIEVDRVSGLQITHSIENARIVTHLD